MASASSQHNKFGNFNKFISTNSERKSLSINLIGNKRLGSNSTDDETLTEQQKINNELLKKNLIGKKKIFQRKPKTKKLPIFSSIINQKTIINLTIPYFIKKYINYYSKLLTKKKKLFLPIKKNLIN